MFTVIDDLKKADELAKAGLLWYTLKQPGCTIVPWRSADITPSGWAGIYKDHEFYILLEE